MTGTALHIELAIHAPFPRPSPAATRYTHELVRAGLLIPDATGADS